MEDAERERQRALVDEGLAAARRIGNPVARGRHLAAWAQRLSVLDPDAAAALAAEFPDDPETRARLLITAAADRQRRHGESPEPHYSAALELGAAAEAEIRLRVVNALCELGIEEADRDRERGLALLRRLVPAVRREEPENPDALQHRALGCALVGEALLLLEEEAGWELLQEAERLSADLPGREPLLLFLAEAIAGRAPEHAAELLAQVSDLPARLEARFQLATRVDDPELRKRVLDAADEDAVWVEHMHGPHVFVRVGHALLTLDPTRAESYFERALAGSEANGPQAHALQLAGVASALAEHDRERTGRLFAEAAEAAAGEEDPGRRVTTLALLADEMAESHPREAQELFDRAMEGAAGLEELWELAHVLDVVFRTGRSEFLDARGARAVLERALSRVSAEDPRIPGVFGIPEAARCMAQIDRDRAAEVLEQWFAAAERAVDSDGMTDAAAAIFRIDAERGRAALTRVRDFLLAQVDCPAMGAFARVAAPLAPDVVLELAPRIPDRRARMEALAETALGLHAQDPERALGLLRELETPVDRSTTLLLLTDRVLETGDRPLPQPLLEDLP